MQQILSGHGRIHVVVGSVALGMDQVVKAPCEAAPEDIGMRDAACGALHEVITGLTRPKSGHRHLVLDLGDAEEPEQRTGLQHLYKWVAGDRQRRTASCLAPPSAAWLWQGEVPGVPVERSDQAMDV